MGEAKQKRAREASNAENSVPGTHGPASAKSAHIMESILRTVKQVFPECDLTLFVFEGGTGRYNYASTVDRDDMEAVLRAFLARGEEMRAVDAAVSKPSEGSA